MARARVVRARPRHRAGVERAPRGPRADRARRGWRRAGLDEDGLAFEVAAPPAQKTGAYFDQRDNRRFVAALARADGRAVLDIGCHVGGFALHARRAGVEVVALDRSAVALAHARANAERNGLGDIHFVEADMFEPLRDPALAGPFGTIVFDPPKLAARRGDVDQALGAASCSRGPGLPWRADTWSCAAAAITSRASTSIASCASPAVVEPAWPRSVPGGIIRSRRVTAKASTCA
ncbi:MAG: methyltransferase domain-containing protein [Nannocystaceae bacterium]